MKKKVAGLLFQPLRFYHGDRGRAIAEEARERKGFFTEVSRVEDIQIIEGFDAVVLGQSPVYGQKDGREQ